MKWIIVRRFNQYETSINEFDSKDGAMEFANVWKSEDYAIEKITVAEVIDEWNHPFYGDAS